MGWGAEDIERLRALAAQGLSAAEIARTLRVSRDSVLGAVRRNSIELRRATGRSAYQERAA